MDDKALIEVRDKIDRLDETIQRLINERAECAQQVADIKLKAGDEKINFYRPEREAQVLRQVMKRNTGPLSDEEMGRLFREIMSACLALEEPIKVSYLGPEGTFTQEAALKHFGYSAKVTPCAAIDEVFREVEAGTSQYGIVPVENSTEGVVNHTLDMFLNSSVHICGEVELRIHHHLLASDATRVDKISHIYSHAQSLAQCRKWLDANYPHAEKVAVSSNGEAAKRIQEEWHSAAIASDMAAKLYHLNVLAPNIEDNPDNSTRFLIIAKDSVPPSGDDKTSIIVGVKNQPGALLRLLEPFSNLGIDLTRVETRPSKTARWNYVFFIDFEGHIQDPVVKSLLENVADQAAEFKWLGSYPKAVL